VRSVLAATDTVTQSRPTMNVNHRVFIGSRPISVPL